MTFIITDVMFVISTQTAMNYLKVCINCTESVAYFKIENFHYNRKLKKKGTIQVNGILQFLRFTPLGLFCYSVCLYLCLPLWVRLSTLQINANCLLMSVTRSAPSCCSQSRHRFDTLKVTAAALLQVSAATSGLSRSLHMTQTSEELRHI